MGVDGAHNTVGKMSVPTTLLRFCHAREVIGYCPVGIQGIVLGIAIDLSALPYFLHPFLVLTERTSLVGWSQSALIALVEAEL